MCLLIRAPADPVPLKPRTSAAGVRFPRRPPSRARASLGGMAGPTLTSHARSTYLPRPREERDGIAICLSGGGFRAAVFELGAIRRLNELGVLSRVSTLSAVSAGSLLAAHLANRLDRWPEPGEVVADFETRVASPFERFAKRNLRTAPLVSRWLTPWNWPDETVAVRRLAELFERYLTSQRMSELGGPGRRPRIVLNATDNAFAATWEMSADRTGNDLAGYTAANEWPVARAAAASASFPPAFEALAAFADPAELTGGEFPPGDERDELIRGLRLNDGGLHDNLGVEAVWRSHRTIISIDGGSVYGPSAEHGLTRDIEILRKQVVMIRKRWLISSFASGELEGTYVGLASHVGSFETDGPRYPDDLVDDLISQVRTDFDAFSDGEIGILENHGYLLAEAAAERHLADLLDIRPARLRIPYPDLMDERIVRSELATSAERRLLGRGRWLPYLF